MWQIMIGHLGHFFLDFFGQIWTQGTLIHILGPIMVIFEICQFLMIPGPFEYFSENGWSQKIKVFLMKERLLPPYWFSFRRADDIVHCWSNIGLLCFILIIWQKWVLLWRLHATPSWIDQDILENVQFWSKHRIATPCFDHLTKTSPVVKVTCKTIENWSRYLVYELIHIYRLLHSYRPLHSYRLLCSYRLQRSFVKMNGFNSKIVCKNSSVTIWENPIQYCNTNNPSQIIFKWGRGCHDNWGFVKKPIIVKPLGSVTMGNPLWYVPQWGGIWKLYTGSRQPDSLL